MTKEIKEKLLNFGKIVVEIIILGTIAYFGKNTNVKQRQGD